MSFDVYFIWFMDIQTLRMDIYSRDQMISDLSRAIRYCEKAQPTDWNDPTQESVATYPGATGYAMGTMKSILQSLECLKWHHF